MASMSVICFKPIYKERIWGGRKLESIYGRSLPEASTLYGESWEVSDRTDDQSVVQFGIYKGKTINQLWNEHREEVFGTGFEASERFPILIKILDATADLSIQVHPPAKYAKKFNGEPKTEMWYIANVDTNAKLHVGLKKEVTKELFNQAINQGTVDQLTHVIHPKAGESIFINSGRLHAICAGNVIFEIQQNSDTTYRVFDWNRKGLNGKPRQLHIEESMTCIDFSDHTPEMDSSDGNSIASCEYFHVEKLECKENTSIENPNPERFSIINIVSGELLSDNGKKHKPGDTILIPRAAPPLTASQDTILLQTTIPL